MIEITTPNPFKNYRQAIQFLRLYMEKSIVMANWSYKKYQNTEEMINVDWAIFTLLRSKKAVQSLRGKK